MSDLVFYTNPMSRGRIARWMLEETGVPYRTQVVEYATMKDPGYLAVNPMGKVPAIAHNGRIVTECAAICAYLADAFPQAELAPTPDERADYYRWMFFCAGPMEAAITDHRYGFDPTPEQGRSVGYGSYDASVDALEKAVSAHAYIAGDRFTAADVIVGSTIGWGTQFGTLPKRDAFMSYFARVCDRVAYRRGNDLDNALMPQPETAA